MQQMLKYGPSEHAQYAVLCRKLQQPSKITTDQPAAKAPAETTEDPEAIVGSKASSADFFRSEPQLEKQRDLTPQVSNGNTDHEGAAAPQQSAESKTVKHNEHAVILRRSARLASKASAATPRSSGHSDDFVKPDQSSRRKRSADDALAGDITSTETRPVKRLVRSRSQRR